MRRIGPYSRPNSLAKVDGRSREGRLMRSTVRELTEHVGGAPSATQLVLIEQAAWLRLHMALMDARLIERSAAPSDRDSRQYLAWSNSLSRLLRQLGPAAKGAAPVDIRSYLRKRAP